MAREEKPMRSQEGVDPYYQRVARDIIDIMFDKRLLNDSLDRETIDKTEDYLAFMFSSIADSAVRSTELKARFRDVMQGKETEAEK